MDVTRKSARKWIDSLSLRVQQALFAAATYLILLAICLLAISPEQYDLSVGDVAPKTITASKDIVDELTTERRRQAAAEEVNLWFRPAALPRDAAVLSAAGLAIPEGEGRQLFSAAAKDQTVGLLLLDGSAYVPQGAGLIARLYLEPGYRVEYTALQLVGQAVSTFRSMGLDRLLLLPPEEVAADVWAGAGFAPAPERPGLLELYIGYDQ